MWEVKSLGEVCEFQRGLTFSKSDRVDAEGIQVLRATNLSLKTGKLTFEDVIQVSSDFEVPDEKKINRGSTLVCTSSGSRSHLGKACWIERSQNIAFGGFLGMLNPRNGIFGKYLFFNLRSRNYQTFLNSIASGSSINNLKWNQLREFEISIPPLEEQQEIVALLDSAFEKIDKAKANVERNLKNAEELFQSALDEVFSNPGEDWEVKALGEVCDISSGGTPSKSDLSLWQNELPWVSPKDMKLRTIVETQDSVSEIAVGNGTRMVESGTILVVVRSGILARTIPIAKSGTRLCFNQDIKALSLKEHLQTDYVLNFLSAKERELLNAVTKSATVHRLETSVLRSLKIPIPPLEEQQEIVTRLEALSGHRDEVVAKCNQELHELEALRQSILEQAFEGNLTQSPAS